MSDHPPIRSISFIGLGLIGMSLLRAMKRSTLAAENRIVFQGYDPCFTSDDRQYAGELGLDRFIEDKSQLYAADLIILAAPVEINIALLDEIRRLAPPDTLVSDISSTKSIIVHRALELGLPFIGMHPMAGKEQQGFRESHEELLHGRRVILCDEKGLHSGEKGRFLIGLLESAGCRTLAMGAEEHDRVIAKVSHLPQLLSTLLMTHCEDAIDKSGPGFATFARLSGSPWLIWRDIIATNSDNIAGELDRFSLEITRLSEDVKYRRFDQIESRFNEANRLHEKLKEMNRQ
jgi:prephenate dehydrogenase